METLFAIAIVALAAAGLAAGLIGVPTQKDCFRSALNASHYRQWRGSVKDHMTPEIETLDASTDFVTAAEAFLNKPFRADPVVRDGELAGVLRRTDLLAAFPHFG